MSEMPLRLLNDWAKEEVLGAIGRRFEELLQAVDGLTSEETTAFRRQHRRVAKMLGFIEAAEPRVASVGRHAERHDPEEGRGPKDEHAVGGEAAETPTPPAPALSQGKDDPCPSPISRRLNLPTR